MLGRRGTKSLHLWDMPGAAVDARIISVGGSGGTIGRESSESRAKSSDEAHNDVQAMGDDPARRNPFPSEPRRRAWPLARAHARARDGHDSGHMGVASADGASRRDWRAGRQHDHGQGRVAQRVARGRAKRQALDEDEPGVALTQALASGCRCSHWAAKLRRATSRPLGVGAGLAIGTRGASCGLWLDCKKRSGPPSRRDGGPLPRRREGDGQAGRCCVRAA